MASLLDLPAELLLDVLERVGGRELRRGKGLLTICRAWYLAALSVYRSGLGTSNIQLYGHNVQSINHKFGYTGLRPLMHKNTRHLGIHLLGHPWDEATAEADEDGGYTTWNKTPDHLEGNEAGTLKVLSSWRDAELRPNLHEIFRDLSNFEAVEHIVVEASSERDRNLTAIPHQDYIYAVTLSTLALNLPIARDLMSFTLDTHGTQLLGTGHACKMLANVLPRIQNVRLRMARICPGILDFKPMQRDEIKLKSLIIKLHSPLSISSAECGSKTWEDIFNPSHDQLFHNMIRACRWFIPRLDATTSNSEHRSLIQIRISHMPMTFPLVRVVDCCSLKQYRLRDEVHAYENDGRPCWFEMEGQEMLVDCGPYVYCR